MKTGFRLCFFLFAVFALASCSSASKNIELAEAQITQFRVLLAAENYQQIYAEVDDGFRSTATLEVMSKVFSVVPRKLGKFLHAERSSWNVRYDLKGQFVTLVYAAQYEKGKATETYVYRISDGKARLYSYNVFIPD
jgi:hypothetical protein